MSMKEPQALVAEMVLMPATCIFMVAISLSRVTKVLRPSVAARTDQVAMWLSLKARLLLMVVRRLPALVAARAKA